MVVLMLFTKLVVALFHSYTIQGKKMPQKDATITRKKTAQLLTIFKEHHDDPLWIQPGKIDSYLFIHSFRSCKYPNPQSQIFAFPDIEILTVNKIILTIHTLF